MIPETIGKLYNVGKVVPVFCVKSDKLQDIDIKENCFLMIMIYEGSLCFKVGMKSYEAIGPCFVCFDETVQPKIIRKHGLKCDSIYFHPTFLNINMTFERMHSYDYEQTALKQECQNLVIISYPILNKKYLKIKFIYICIAKMLGILYN